MEPKCAAMSLSETVSGRPATYTVSLPCGVAMTPARLQPAVVP